MKIPHITVIGSGYSGSLVAYHLVKKTQRPLRLTLLDRAGTFGKGIAYSTSDRAHLLNVPAGNMSAFPSEPGDFVRWLKENGKFEEGRSFYSRVEYGEYISSLLSDALESAGEKSIEIQLITDEAIRIQRNANKDFSVVTGTGKNWVSDTLVFALGNFPPGSFTQLFPSLKEFPRYITKFWTNPIFPFIPKNSTVGIIGTGLSMVDAALSLDSRKHQGKIIAFSRNGFLPKAHKPKNPNYRLVIPEEAKGGPLKLLQFLRKEIQSLPDDKTQWTDVLDGLRPHTNQIWMGWSLSQKKQFLRRLRPYWDTHRHRMAPEVWEKIHALVKGNRLEIIPSRIRSIEANANAVELQFQRKGKSGGESIQVDYLIDCSGPEGDYRKLNEPIVLSILENTNFQIDPTGMGLSKKMGAADDECAHIIGPLNKGFHFETTAVPELRVQAEQLAEKILGRIK